ncbi:MAG TPA: hypothetical protein DD435_03145 [Cyanobacteria bacterium UBA8530]|nr:hypothetical protein [Cyanobacteria bacterium UBA8530]
MPATMTRFHLAPHGRGMASLLKGMRALSAVLPNAQLEAIRLDGHRFPIDTRCFPASIWQRLAANPEWQLRLIEQLESHIGAASPQKELLREKFSRRLQRPYCRIHLLGSLPFDPDGTPGILAAWGIPRLRAMGCKLSVLDDTMRHPREEALALRKLQIQLWSSELLFIA